MIDWITGMLGSWLTAPLTEKFVGRLIRHLMSWLSGALTGFLVMTLELAPSLVEGWFEKTGIILAAAAAYGVSLLLSYLKDKKIIG